MPPPKSGAKSGLESRLVSSMALPETSGGEREVRTRLIITLFAVLVVGFVFLAKFHYVDPRPALYVGEDYFGDLRRGQIDDAFAMYTDGFLGKVGEEWRKVVTDLDAENGNVVDFKVLDSHVVPLTLRDRSEIPCVLIRYEITRKMLSSNEALMVCPHQRAELWAIAGHEITRKDTGEHFLAGITVMEKTILRSK